MRAAGTVFAGIYQNILKNTQNRGQKWAEAKLYFWRYNSGCVLWINYTIFSRRNNQECRPRHYKRAVQWGQLFFFGLWNAAGRGHGLDPSEVLFIIL